MPTISFDGQSFLIDGRRTWLVSGSIHYARTPRQLWPARLRAAKQAGLNCIDTYVFWNLHEPRPGVFNFEGDADLRHFIQLIQREGMYCILRPGPYICAEWDFGGLPGWLHRVEGMKLREANGPFLEACARYLGAVMEQVKDLQATVSPLGRKPTHPVNPGPIVMVQAENEWLCHHPAQGEKYLREIVRYLRESGCETPINVCNNLWQRVEGAIDTWNSNEHLATDLRQLHAVQPDAPRIVTEFWPGWFDSWGGEHHHAYTAEWNLYRLAQILASGAQYNLYMFHGGTNFDFYGGRTIASPDCFITTSYDYDAPLREAGGRGAKYHAIKRISTFASQFAQLFAHLEPGPPHAAITPGDGEHGLSVIHQHGAQGDVVFLLRGPADKAASANIMLPRGVSVNVPLGKDRVAWFVFNANLGGVADLTYTTLRPWAFTDKRMLVLFGPAGAEGRVAINDTPWTVTVPAGRNPLVERHEGLTVVVLNEEQVDAAYLVPTGLAVGCAGLDDADAPIPRDDWAGMTLITHAGDVKRTHPKPARTPTPPRAGKWEQATVTDLINGESKVFKPIDGPASLEALGQNFGYGWYRLALKSPRSAKALAPLGGDRLHIYNHGKLDTILGLGPGAEFDPADVKLGSQTVVLADNLGRFNFGWHTGEQKGLLNHIYEVKPLRLPRPQVLAGAAPDPFELAGFFVYLRQGERPPADALVWKIQAPPKQPLVVDILGMTPRAMLIVNGKAVGIYDKHFCAGFARFLLEPGKQLRGGRNEIKLAFFQKLNDPAEPLKSVKFYQATANLTEAAAWSFAPWSPPAGEDFGPLTRAAGDAPRWFRCQLSVAAASTPLWLEPVGMSKGQLYLNGHNLGRYWVNSPAGKPVPPQQRYYLPEPWLKTDGPNELMLFDEHGRSPEKCRFVYDAMGPYGE